MIPLEKKKEVELLKTDIEALRMTMNGIYHGLSESLSMFKTDYDNKLNQMERRIKKVQVISE